MICAKRYHICPIFYNSVNQGQRGLSFGIMKRKEKSFLRIGTFLIDDVYM